ncbi:MAG TPA: toll/interleukin-1 receptor domain-containing protein [Thermoanaerobaculia bacterium]|jgi:tetratricopeptide (TPR) repeat protein|nr:toll/interleukin-1 receptor domain-containing protein [Thermoanaerobaculia bacterium]
MPPQPTAPAGDRPTVFLSYSHQDRSWLDRLNTMLAPLVRTGAVELWWDGQIPPGQHWREQIDDAMATAEVAVLLVSAPFLASQFIAKVELPYFLDAARGQHVKLLWVPVSPCLYEHTPLAEIQAAHDPSRPLSTLPRAEREVALRKICLEIEKAARRRSGEPVEKPPLPASPRIDATVSTSHLPLTSSLFVGRETERAEMDAAWDDPATNVFSLVALGGAGKSSLVNAWLEDLWAEDWRGAERIFGWSFYSQGTEATGASGDSFVNEALWWFGYRGDPITSPWEKGVVLARLIRERRTLLILDGLEPLQHPPGAQTGRIKDLAVAALVRELAVQNPGLCVITTRLAVADVAGKAGAASSDLEKLPPEAGAALLRELGVTGSDSELRRASEEFGGYALALTLLGTYLRDICDGDVRRHGEVPLLEDDDEHAHARRVIAKYAEWLQEPDLQALRLLGLFDRPARPDALKALRAEPAIPDLTDAIGPAQEARWRKALARLREARLILKSKEPGALDAHPLVRAYFQEELEEDRPEAWREGNLRLYEHLKGSAPDLPDTLEEMEPLFTAVIHGCRAGRQQEAMGEVYWRRILRGREFYSTRKLGAFGSDLTALSGFFDHPWDQPSTRLTPADQAFVLAVAGFDLRALGRLAEAVQPMQASLRGYSVAENWKGAARTASNLSELTLTLGEVPRAVAFGEQSVELADRSGDAFLRMVSRTKRADALHQAGRWEESAEAFREAEAMQAEWQPKYPRLYSLPGYLFCDLLLSRAEPEDGAGLAGLAANPEQARRFREACRGVRERGEQFFEWRVPSDSLLDIALDHLSLGQAHLGLALTAPGPATPGEEAEAELARSAEHLDRAVEGLRQAGYDEFLSRGLLARAAFRRLRDDRDGAKADLDESLEIAERGSMRLHACDAHLEWARLYLQQGDAGAAAGHVAAARKLVDETKYGLREREVEWLEHHLVPSPRKG